jgi:hypothetical protein
VGEGWMLYGAATVAPIATSTFAIADPSMKLMLMRAEVVPG